MNTNKKIISKELNDQLRSVTFNPTQAPSQEPETVLPDPTIPVTMPKKVLPKPPSLNKRIVTVEYLDKLEEAVVAETRYESLKSFSHLLSNVSIVLLSVSIITYLIFYVINPQSLSLIALLLLAFEAFTLLGATLFTISKTSALKQISDLAVSDLSTSSHIIGNPRADAYIPSGGLTEEESYKEEPYEEASSL